MKKIYFLYIALILALIVFVVRSDLKKETDSWERTYKKQDKGPMGGFFFYEILRQRAGSISHYSQSVYKLSDSVFRPSTLVFYEDIPNYTSTDSLAIWKLLEQGHDIIIINPYLGYAFSKFRIRSEYHYTPENDSLFIKPDMHLIPTFRTGLRRSYPYPVYCQNYFFNSFDTTSLKIFLTGDSSRVYGLCYTHSKGNCVFFISIKDIFANYFVCNHPNRYLVYALLDYLIPAGKNILWYGSFKDWIKEKSPLDLIFNNRQLYTAWLILLFTLLFYAIFDSRRNARMIPVIHAPENQTISFIEVIANVYFKRKYHSVILKEKIHYFSEWIRKNYHMDIMNVRDKEMELLASLSGIPLSSVKRMVQLCRELYEKNEITTYELTEADKTMNLFVKKSNLKTIPYV